jgi:hypothetical protein
MLVAGCKRLGGDPFAYLKDVLQGLPTYPTAGLADRLHEAVFAARPCDRRKIAS